MSTLAASPSRMLLCAGERHVHRSERSAIGDVSCILISPSRLVTTKRQLASSGLPASPKKPWPSSVTTVPPEKTPACGSTESTVGGL